MDCQRRNCIGLQTTSIIISCLFVFIPFNRSLSYPSLLQSCLDFSPRDAVSHSMLPCLSSPFLFTANIALLILLLPVLILFCYLALFHSLRSTYPTLSRTLSPFRSIIFSYSLTPSLFPHSSMSTLLPLSLLTWSRGASVSEYNSTDVLPPLGWRLMTETTQPWWETAVWAG